MKKPGIFPAPNAAQLWKSFEKFSDFF